jgi:hypothetical protein
MNLYQSQYKKSLVLLIVLLVGASVLFGAAGKISGRVVDSATNDPLIGVNIIVEGTSIGTSTDQDGYFILLNVSPGTYRVVAQMIGYAETLQENVRVSTNRTTNADFTLMTEAIQGETVVVEAQRPPIQMDVSSSQIIVTSEDLRNRPLDNFEEILAAEAGISMQASSDGTGLIIRGGDINETDIVVDGISTRNERNQQPMTGLNLTAIKEVEIITGGFNAEFGNVRSGMVNVVTKDGSLDKYSFDLDMRYGPPQKKHFGPSPYGIDGPFWNVYAGEDAFTGVSSEMVDDGSYPFTFVGWNEVARQFLADPDDSNDMTPQELAEVWKWQHRIRKYGDKPDIIGDFSISGKVPLLPVTFLFSQRSEDMQLAYPFSRNNSINNSTILKFTMFPKPGMRLSFQNQYMVAKGVSGSIYDDSNGMITGTRAGTEYARNAMFWRYMWHDANYNPIETNQYKGGLTLNHLLSDKTFYDVSIEYSKYNTNQEPIALRDTSGIQKIGNSYYDEAPFGYVGSEIGSIIEKYDIIGDFLMSGGGRGQDHSKYQGIRAGFDIVSQINRRNEVKAGLDLSYTEFNERREINHGATSESFEVSPGNWWYFDESPIQIGGYVQDKIEYEGMIANIGLRFDYLNPGNSPYNLDPAFIFSELPYSLSHWRENDGSFDDLTTKDDGYQMYISPRLAVSHPVTDNSKVFFSYNHLYQPPVTDRLFTVRPNSSGASLPNIQANWPKTIQYEIGLEKGFGNGMLLHFGGYYKDVTDQLSSQNIVALDGANNISTYANNSYSDIRGLELKLEKRYGDWWYGWVALDYMISSTGYTGLRYIYEDRQKAREQNEQTNQERDAPVPSVTANLTFKTPSTFGPEVLGHNILGDWRLNIIQEYSGGGEVLINPEARLNDQHYVGVIDFFNTDIMLEKALKVANSRFSVYMQVKNLFNYKGLPEPLHYNQYIDSLRFPHETGDQKGDDKIGDHEQDYIELGWNTWAHFVNPRYILFGVKIQL